MRAPKTLKNGKISPYWRFGDDCLYTFSVVDLQCSRVGKSYFLASEISDCIPSPWNVSLEEDSNIFNVVFPISIMYRRPNLWILSPYLAYIVKKHYFFLQVIFHVKLMTIQLATPHTEP